MPTIINKEKEKIVTRIIGNIITNHHLQTNQVYYYNKYEITTFIDIEFKKILLAKFSEKELVKLSERIKLFYANKPNSNQLASFYEMFRYLRNHPNSLDLKKDKLSFLFSEIKNIEQKKLLTMVYSKRAEDWCKETYPGFLRSQTANTLYTAKVKINGVIKRVFIKTPIGKTRTEDLGFNKLMIDPDTFRLYTFKTDNSGKIIEKSIRPPKLNTMNRNVDNSQYISLEEFKTRFTYNLVKYIDEKYGLENLISSYTVFGGKTNLERLENSKDIIFSYLKDKYKLSQSITIFAKLIKSILIQQPRENQEFVREYLSLVIKETIQKNTKPEEYRMHESLFKKTIFEDKIKVNNTKKSKVSKPSAKIRPK
ncbi:MAG: hypothetical protein WCX82_00055 [archaeon]|jgi:hypothetical protein